MYVLTVCGGRTTAVLVQVQVYTRTGSLAEGERATVLEYSMSTGTRVLGWVVLNGTYYNGIFGRLLICMYAETDKVYWSLVVRQQI